MTIPAWIFFSFVVILFLFLAITAFTMLMTLVMLARYSVLEKAVAEVKARIEDTELLHLEICFDKDCDHPTHAREC